MRLFLTDYHLEMARMLLAESEGNSAAADLITATGYHRRDQELADLQQALVSLTSA